MKYKPKDTLEIYAFMEAAGESKRKCVMDISHASVLQKAKANEINGSEHNPDLKN